MNNDAKKGLSRGKVLILITMILVVVIIGLLIWRFLDRPCEHVFGEWKTVVTADCETDGRDERACTLCTFVQIRTVYALGHDDVSHEAKEPTCTEIGWDIYITCSRCGRTNYAEKASLGHQFSAEWTYDADGHHRA